MYTWKRIPLFYFVKPQLTIYLRIILNLNQLYLPMTLIFISKGKTYKSMFLFRFYFLTWKNQMHHVFHKEESSKPKLFLENTTLPFVNNIKILGLVFDSKFTWKPHIIQTKTTAIKSINIIKTLNHVEWGIESNIIINLYKTLVKSKLDYGAICYNNANPNILKNNWFNP